MSEEYGAYYLDGNVTPVVRWKSNNAIPFDDVLSKLFVAGLITKDIFTNSHEKREEEQLSFIQEYKEKMKDYKYAEEDIHEMKSAFGDAPVVNVITGEKIKF